MYNNYTFSIIICQTNAVVVVFLLDIIKNNLKYLAFKIGKNKKIVFNDLDDN